MKRPESAAAVLPPLGDPTSHVRPSRANSDGQNEHLREDQCATRAPRMRKWHPAWAVMAPALNPAAAARSAGEHPEEP